jgi:prepilin-type N-terminal cleavage/methylation domain-containing protein
MRTRKKNLSNKLGFSLIEVLVTLGIIAILVGLLVPALNMARDVTMKVAQQSQLRTIGDTLDDVFAYNSGYNDCPPSNNNKYDFVDTGNNHNYTGAQKLAEALVGMDGFGWHPDSVFSADGTDNEVLGEGTFLYDTADITSRKGPYMELNDAGAVRLKDIYRGAITGEFGNPFNGDDFVLTDVYGTAKHNTSGNKIGMPILYYRANTAGTDHDSAIFDPSDLRYLNNNAGFIYRYHDNFSLLSLGTQDGDAHPMYSDWQWFYEKTTNPNISYTPYNGQSFILQSAGPDGLYGTPDDVFNF